VSYLQAFVIAVVQGVTELFPVSSLGHSVLIPAWIGGSWQTMVTQSSQQSSETLFYLAYIVALHCATALALLWFFRADWARIIRGRGRKRAPEKVDAPSGVLRRIVGVSAELRGAEVPRFAPSDRERPVVMLGVEGPDVEVLDAVLPVHVMQGSALAQGAAQQTADIAAGATRIALEKPGLRISAQSREAQKVSYFDTGQRPIHVLGHAAILPPKLRIDARPRRATCGRRVRGQIRSGQSPLAALV
jgi:Bacitracin resistance protein BacA